MKITDEMVGAAMLAYMKETAAEEFQVSGWLESALRAALTAALAVQTQQGVKAIRAQAIEDVLAALTAHELYQYRPKAFKGFIEYARTTLVSEEEASVWRSALVDVPAVESEPVADPEPIAWYLHLWNEADEDIKSDVRWGQPTLDEIERAEHNGHDIEYLYGSHPPRSLSNEGSEVIAKATEALEAAREWIGILRSSIGDVYMGSFDNRDPSVVEKRTSKLISEAITALSTRKGSSEGDGSATSTKGVSE